jgi:hypothetical protein
MSISVRGRRWSSALMLVLVGAAGPLALAGRGAPAGAAANPAPPAVPSSGAYFGATATTRNGESRQSAVTNLEAQIGRNLDIDHQFYKWDETLPGAHQRWDAEHGRIPFVSWKPQTKAGAAVSWGAVAAGSHDTWITAQADRVRAFGQPLFMVFNHEPYDQSKSGWGTPADFVAAWRHIVDAFRARGATNAAWVLVLTGYDYTVAGRANAFYPGDGYVDWIGADPYNFLTRDGVWKELSTVSQGFVDWAAPKHKPLMLAEWGTEEDPHVAGRKAQWLANAQNWVKSQPAIKAVVYFHSNIVYPWWADTSPSSLSAFRAMANELYFRPAVPSGGDGSGPPAGPVLPLPPLDPVTLLPAGSGGGAGLLPVVGQPPPPARSGYWMADAGGHVYAFGDAAHHGAPAGALGGATVVDLEGTPSSAGYWVVDERGRVHPFGDAAHRGDVSGGRLAAGERATSLSRTPSGNGYWVFTNRGRVFAFGDAPFLGDQSGVALNAPVVDSVATPGGTGYYMVAADGGVFSFGDARFFGSMGGRKINAPVRSLVPDADGAGYWLVATDGGVFAFDAPFLGSMGGVRLNRPVRGMVRYGRGYLMVGEDGGIFNFSALPFGGSLGDRPSARPVVAVAAIA